MKLKIKLIAIVLSIAIIPMASLTVIQSIQSSAEIRSNTNAALISQRDAAAIYVNTFLTEAQEAVEDLVDSPATIDAATDALA